LNSKDSSYTYMMISNMNQIRNEISDVEDELREE